LAVFDYWRKQGCRINREFFICGNGIERLFEGIVAIRGIKDQQNLSAPDIQRNACSGKEGPLEQLCADALSAFCGFLGSAAGDQVLCTGSRGGLILAGGILPRCVDFLQHSEFRNRFESKGVMSDYTKQVSTKLIVEPQPGLIGAAACGMR
jgi:glucokinase